MSETPKRQQPWRDTLTRKNRVPLYLSDEEYESLRERAFAEKTDMTAIARRALARELGWPREEGGAE